MRQILPLLTYYTWYDFVIFTQIAPMPSEHGKIRPKIDTTLTDNISSVDVDIIGRTGTTFR